MPKKILRDIVNVSSDSKKRKKRTSVRKESDIELDYIDETTIKDRVRAKAFSSFFSTFAERKKQQTYTPHTPSSGPRFALWGVAVAALLFVVFILLSFFSGAVVNISPLKESVVLDTNLTAYKEQGGLPFQLIVLQGSEVSVVSATEERTVERKAEGQIIIFNTFSSKTQVLVKNTRFQDPEGLIYRIRKQITVPGTTVEGGEIVPGQLEVTVYADFTGAEYNRGLTDFTIPGFKGDPRFDSFFARSKTSMEGGFSGVVKTASESDIASARVVLQNTLRTALIAKARLEVPEGFILYDDAVFFEFEEGGPGAEETTGDALELIERGALHGIIFDKSALARNIARTAIPLYDEGKVFSRDLEDLSFSITDKEDLSPTEVTEVSFSFAGAVEIIWEVDKAKLTADLAGTPKIDFSQTISTYGNIKKAEANIRPFWKKTFPTDEARIEIKLSDSPEAMEEMKEK